ncbi:hypothetical protein B0H11DRAFT_537433 [Mycena galericulata]|nr:hypothetical protein B0H11DRAFT_537433 [Mycena galericulata]
MSVSLFDAKLRLMCSSVDSFLIIHFHFGGISVVLLSCIRWLCSLSKLSLKFTALSTETRPDCVWYAPAYVYLGIFEFAGPPVRLGVGSCKRLLHLPFFSSVVMLLLHLWKSSYPHTPFLIFLALPTPVLG